MSRGRSRNAALRRRQGKVWLCTSHLRYVLDVNARCPLHTRAHPCVVTAERLFPGRTHTTIGRTTRPKQLTDSNEILHQQGCRPTEEGHCSCRPP